MPPRRLGAACLALAVTLGWLAPAARAQEEAGRAAALEAAFLYNFAKFTNWPASRFRGGDDPVVFCVGAGSRLQGAIAALDGKPLQGRSMRVMVLGQDSGASDCHVLFVDEAISPGLRETVAGHAIPGLLTVADREDYARIGSDILLFNRGNQLRFQINLVNARKNAITFSSKLLQLADTGPQSDDWRALPVLAARPALAAAGRRC